MNGIVVERVGNKIELKGWIGQSTPTRCKAVGGGKWEPTAKVWRFPLSMTTCRNLRTQFGSQLTVGPELATWARAEVAREREMSTLAAQDAAELVWVPKLAPTMAAAMSNRTYQQVGAAFAAKAENLLLADQPGLGKTIQTLGAILEACGDRPGAHLVLCPKVAVGAVWGPEVAQWLGGGLAEVFLLKGTRPQRERTLAAANAAIEDGARHVFVVGNIEMVRIRPEQRYDENTDRQRTVFDPANADYPELFSTRWATVVVDESHRALIRASKPTATRAGMTALEADRRIALSGTPMRGKPHQLWGTLNWLEPGTFTSYWRWVERYYKVTSNGFSNFVLDGMKDGAEDALAADLGTIMLRRTKAEVLAELPPKQYAGTYLIPGDPNSPHGVWLEPSPAQARQMRELTREGMLTTATGEIVATGHLAEATRQKQIAGAVLEGAQGDVRPVLPSPKFDWIVEKLGELGIGPDGEGDARLVVASQFTSLLNLFARELRALGHDVHLLTGETPDKARSTMVADFQSDNPSARIFLLNTKAGGVAVTLDAADELVILDETYVPDDQEQVEDRIHRTSRMHNVTIHYLRTLGSIEEEIAWITAAREDVMRYILDGARGVETAKALYSAKLAA